MDVIIIVFRPLPASLAGGVMSDGSQSGVLYAQGATGNLKRFLTDPNIPEEQAILDLGWRAPIDALGYGYDGHWYAAGGPAGNQLFRLHPATPGSLEPIGTGAHRIEDIASFPATGQLFGVGDGILFLIDPITGAQTDIAPLGFVASGLGFDSDGNMFVGSGDQLVQIDRTTGQVLQTILPNQGPIVDLAGSRYEVDCPGDLDNNYLVDLADLTGLLSHFGIQQGALGPDGDIDGDGAVDLTDLARLLSAFGRVCQ